ncbi:MAG: asparagine synthase (glutamine-hydrolyzing) [Betaproteobacteria bacterium]|nr:asparagine synthase (glutamine-hydrolyzing) [Betaproteobacteria bacterium]
MCGIAGFLALSGAFAPVPAPARVLGAMADALAHRGPDDRGIHVNGPAGLAHRRLSIVDLSSAGHQPFASSDGSVVVSFNGEIFNYLELRRELEGRGHVFRSHSDTETIVEAYRASGPACVESFNGDFAYALWDSRARRLVLARDRMGVRPLYYAMAGGALVFASEVKAILEYPGMRAELDPVALDQTFTFWFPLAPRTPWKGILELPPGHQLVAEGGRVRVERYWSLAFPERSEARADSRSEGEIAEALEALLEDATRIRLRADVPVGAYLSGGFDSSATTALAKRVGAGRLRTFSVGFESAEFDESAYQREVVDALGTEHTALACRREHIGACFPEVVRHAERPMLRTAPAPLFLLAREVRASGFKVVVTGEGADEVFGGYDVFKEAKVRRFWARQPTSAWRPALLRRLYPYLAGVQAQSLEYLRAFFRTGLERAGDPLFSHLPRFELTRRARRFYSPELQASLAGYDAMEELRTALPAEFSRWHPLSQAQYLESAYLLPGYILAAQGDRVAMAHAVEGRFPFLDHRVVEFAARIPPRLKLKGLREKHILRRALGRHLPASIGERPKQPYRAPDSESFAQAPYVEELFSARAISEAGFFSAAAAAKLRAKCRASGPIGVGDNMAFVGILSTQLLHSQYVQGALSGRAERAAAALV